MNARQIAQLIDHTLLRPEATRSDMQRLCEEAMRHEFWSVCVHPSAVPFAATILEPSRVKICTTAGFPLGATSTEAKVCETEVAIHDGAHEIDMVINLGALKSGDDTAVAADIRAVTGVCHEAGARCKVILEMCWLDAAEKERAAGLALESGADYLKTSTGFGPGGATVEDVALLHRLVNGKGIGVKAAGGIRTLADLERMVLAGATRIGTSNAVKIMQELK